MKIEISDAFQAVGFDVYSFYQRPGVGFYIPLYQRQYSWDKDNVEQFLEDIEKGVEKLVEHQDAGRFLGTIIEVAEDKKKVQPQDPKALPTAVEKIIDGQQRLTTIALLSTLLYKHISEIEQKLLKFESNNKSEYEEICTYWKTKLIDIFSVDMKGGSPKRKPKIIREHEDFWVKDDTSPKHESYKSDTTNFFAKFLYALDKKQVLTDIKPIENKERFKANFEIIEKWLKSILNSKNDQDATFPKAIDLLDGAEIQECIWGYEREELASLINTPKSEQQTEAQFKKTETFLLSNLVQLFSLCHYLLERCYFTVINPKNEEWAFDMFQSLNASGTPLTAIETFKPLVVNVAGDKNENSDINKYFDCIENLFRDENSAATKSKLTNEFLTSFAIVANSTKLEGHFSAQRKYLNDIYKDLSTEEKTSFIRFMGNYAEFYKTIWRDYKEEKVIDKINANQEADLASLLILFLKKSNHKMSITILGYFYHDVLTGKEHSISNFVEAVKAIAAFYILWRSAGSNTGLDNVYRNFFKKEGKNTGREAQDFISKKGASLDIKDLKKYFQQALAKNLSEATNQPTGVLFDEYLDKTLWLKQAGDYLKYETVSTVCTINLLIAAHDTIEDTEAPGLMKIGYPKSNPNYLKLEMWRAKYELEHIAPKSNQTNWDENLYTATKLHDSIGNLTLLPKAINASASNKGWAEKLLYYRHLGEKDPSKAQELAIKAKNEGIDLSKNTIDMLLASDYNSHIAPLLSVENWNKQLVEARTQRILGIVWDRVIKWLN